MFLMQRVSPGVWGFMGLLFFLIGVHLIVGMMQDVYVLASAYQTDSMQDRSHNDAGSSAKIIDQAQEQDDGFAGPDSGEMRAQPGPAGLRTSGPLMPGQFQLHSGPFRPPRLLQ